jgi:hypothetical protein
LTAMRSSADSTRRSSSRNTACSAATTVMSRQRVEAVDEHTGQRTGRHCRHQLQRKRVAVTRAVSR